LAPRSGHYAIRCSYTASIRGLSSSL